MTARHHDYKPVDAKGVSLQPLGASQVSQHTNIGMALGYGRRYLVTDSLLQCDVDAGVGRKPSSQDIREVFF
jgi:hypothetical protein